MKISVDGEQVLELSETQKKVIQNDILLDAFESDMRRRIKYIVDHPCERCIDIHKKEWLDSLKSRGVSSVPSDKMGFAEIVLQDLQLDPHEDRESSVSVDGVEEFKVSKTQKKLLKYARKSPNEFVKSQVAWILSHKYERCMERLRNEWEPKLASRGISQFPIDDDAFAELVFSQPDYKNRSQREAESLVMRG